MLTSDLNVCGGDVVIAGTRLPAYLIASMVESGVSKQELMDDYGISEANIRECVDYAEYGGVVEIDMGDDLYCNVELFVWVDKRNTYVKMSTPFAFRTVYHDDTVYTHTATDDNYKDLRHELVKFWFEEGAEMIEVYVEEVFILDRHHVNIYAKSLLEEPYIITKDGDMRGV